MSKVFFRSLALAHLPYQPASPCSPLQINHSIQAGLLHVTQETEASCLVRNFSLLQSPPKIYFRVPVSDLNYASPSALRQFCCRYFPFTLGLHNICCYQTPQHKTRFLRLSVTEMNWTWKKTSRQSLLDIACMQGSCRKERSQAHQKGVFGGLIY